MYFVPVWKNSDYKLQMGRKEQFGRINCGLLEQYIAHRHEDATRILYCPTALFSITLHIIFRINKYCAYNISNDKYSAYNTSNDIYYKYNISHDTCFTYDIWNDIYCTYNIPNKKVTHILKRSVERCPSFDIFSVTFTQKLCKKNGKGTRRKIKDMLHHPCLLDKSSFCVRFGSRHSVVSRTGRGCVDY